MSDELLEDNKKSEEVEDLKEIKNSEEIEDFEESQEETEVDQESFDDDEDNKLEVIELENTEVEATEVEAEIVITVTEAKKLTKDIKSTSNALYALLKRAHDEKAWVAMGYKSWTEYIEKEFDFSRARSYQLINQAKVIEEINEASGVSLYISERDARSIKNRLPEITEKLKSAGVSEMDYDEAKEKTQNVIEEEKVDNAEKYDDGTEDYEAGFEDEKYDDGLDEWEPDNVDMSKIATPLSKENEFYFSHLTTTFDIFDELPEPVEFGKAINKANKDKEKLSKKAKDVTNWINSLMNEIEYDKEGK